MLYWPLLYSNISLRSHIPLSIYMVTKSIIRVNLTLLWLLLWHHPHSYLFIIYFYYLQRRNISSRFSRTSDLTCVYSFCEMWSISTGSVFCRWICTYKTYACWRSSLQIYDIIFMLISDWNIKFEHLTLHSFSKIISHKWRFKWKVNDRFNVPKN